MRYLTIKAFKFSELSERAKENARENYRKEYECDQIPWAEENSVSIRKICEALNCEYEIDSYNHCFLTFQGEDEVLTLKGARAYKYVWNNFIEPNLTPKFICGCKIKGKLHYGCVSKDSINYYSKVAKEFNCPFTGYCADMLLLDAFNVWKDDVKEYETDVECFLNRVGYCIENFLNEEEAYYDSNEYIEEMIEANNFEFDEDGEIL